MEVPISIKAISVATALLVTCALSRAQSADGLMETGDVLALKFQSGEALKDYLAAEKLEPKNVRLLVRISREYRHLMSDVAKTEEKLRLGGIAVEYGKRAAALGPRRTGRFGPTMRCCHRMQRPVSGAVWAYTMEA